MKQSEQLIAAAKRYCREHIYHHEHFWDIHDPKTTSSYPLDVPMQADLSTAILDKLDRITDKCFDSIEQGKEEIKQFAIDESDKRIRPFNTKENTATTGELKVINVVKRCIQQFINFIDELSADELESTTPVPYRRRLTEAESKVVRSALEQYWQFEGFYWVPLMGHCRRPLIYFDDDLIESRTQETIEMIRSLPAQRIYELNEFGEDFEIDHTEFEKPYYGELVFTDKVFSWIIYQSHEGTITYGGDWLLAEVEKRWYADIGPGNRNSPKQH